MISGLLTGKDMGVMLVKQVRETESKKHVSHSQTFNSLEWFGKQNRLGEK